MLGKNKGLGSHVPITSGLFPRLMDMMGILGSFL